jgi:hypothetical protein
VVSTIRPRLVVVGALSAVDGGTLVLRYGPRISEVLNLVLIALGAADAVNGHVAIGYPLAGLYWTLDALADGNCWLNEGDAS